MAGSYSHHWLPFFFLFLSRILYIFRSVHIRICSDLMFTSISHMRKREKKREIGRRELHLIARRSKEIRAQLFIYRGMRHDKRWTRRTYCWRWILSFGKGSSNDWTQSIWSWGGQRISRIRNKRKVSNYKRKRSKTRIAHFINIHFLENN